MSNERLIPKTSAAGKETFKQWATRVLGPEVAGVTDWSLYRECWEAALKWKAKNHGRPQEGQDAI